MLPQEPTIIRKKLTGRIQIQHIKFMSQTQSVSVVIPSYNRADMVVETIRNLQAQSLPPQEIIVVDDGSSDGSPEIIRRLRPEVTVIEQENQGPGAARNTGFVAATCKFIQFMDSDDLASLNKLEVQATALETTDADMAFCPWFHIEWGKGLKTTPKEVIQTLHPGNQRSLLEWHLRGWTLILQNCLFKRTFLEKVGPQKTDLLGTEDWEFFNRIFLADPKAVFTPDCLVLYRLHDSGKLSGSGTSSKRKAEELSKAARYIHSNISRQSTKISTTSRLLLSARFQSIEKHGGSTILSDGPSILEKVFFALKELKDRVSSGISRRCRGYYWPSYYHSVKPKRLHFSMMKQAKITYTDEPTD